MTVLLLATTTGYQIRSFGDAAGRLGIRLVFASDRCDQLEDPWWDAAIPIRFHEEDASVDAIARGLDLVAPDGIIAVGDRPTVLAARVAEFFGLPGNPPGAAAASRNKLETRRALRAAGLNTPAFQSFTVDEDVRRVTESVLYPAVIKPLALSGSRGVMRVDDPRECAAAFDRLRLLLDSPDVRLERDRAHDRVMIESFVPGKEFAVEGVLTAGRCQTFAIFDKPDPLEGPFFEETIYLTPSREEARTQALITATVASAARALGLRHGPVHAECRVDGDEVYVLEVAARPIGGLCSRALSFRDARGTSASLEEVLLRHAIGEDVAHYEREACASGVMMIPIPARGIYKGVEGLEEARAVSGVTDLRITAKPDSLLLPLPEGRSYLGFVFARGAAPAMVDAALREAHSRLRFTIDRALIVAD